ncbi:coilin [Menidia menidia]
MAPPGNSFIRMRLLFDYPPPAAVGCRMCWLLVDMAACRVVADLESMVRERFGFSRRSILSLFMEDCYLPHTESIYVVRDNDSVRVKVDSVAQLDSGAQLDSVAQLDPLSSRPDPPAVACRKRHREDVPAGEERKKKKKKKKREWEESPPDCTNHAVVKAKKNKEKRTNKKPPPPEGAGAPHRAKSTKQPPAAQKSPSPSSSSASSSDEGGALKVRAAKAPPSTPAAPKAPPKTKPPPPSAPCSGTDSPARRLKAKASPLTGGGGEDTQLLTPQPAARRAGGAPRRHREEGPAQPVGGDGSRATEEQRGLDTSYRTDSLTNASVLLQNGAANGAAELPKQDYSSMPLLAAPPQVGRKIAFKILELTDNYTPEVSEYKEGRIVSFDPGTKQIELELQTVSEAPAEPGKFDLVYQNPDGSERVEYAVSRGCWITENWASLLEPRLIL